MLNAAVDRLPSNVMGLDKEAIEERHRTMSESLDPVVVIATLVPK